MKIIDRQGRLFGKLSVIDLLVLLVVVILAASLYLKRNVMEHTSPTASIVYEVKISGIREDMLDNWQVGDEVYDTDNDSGSAIGVITQIRSEPSQSSAALADGTYATYTMEGRQDVYLTLSADGLVSNGRTYVNRTYEINVNSSRSAYTKYANFECIITEIQQ
jgi:hypothetical protein